MKFIRILFLFTIFLGGCSATSNLPVPNATGNISYPVPSNTIPTIIDPTRDPEKSTVQGRLLLNGKPVTHGIIYFSRVIQDNTGKDIVVGLDRTSPLNSDLNKNGQFKVVNIPSGKYGIVFDLVSQGTLLDAPGKEESLLVNIVKGQDIDLGDLNYSNLPEP